MTDEPQVTYLTIAQASELPRLGRLRSIECGAMTANPMCAGCDGGAMDGGGRCRHDCHDSYHRYDPARGITCGGCGGTSGKFGPAPQWWTCGHCALHAPVDDIELIPGMATTDVEVLRRRAHMLAKEGKDAYDRGLVEGRQHRAGQVDALTRAAYEDGKGDGRAEGRRQATEGLEREWAVQAADGEIYVERDENSARTLARGWAGDVTVVSRLTSRWEPAKQDEPDPPTERLSAENIASILAVVDAPYRPGLEAEYEDDEPAEHDGADRA